MSALVFLMEVLVLLCLASPADGQLRKPEAARKDVVVVTATYDWVPLAEIDRSVRILPVRELSLVSNMLDYAR